MNNLVEHLFDYDYVMSNCLSLLGLIYLLGEALRIS
jgi:hypothetical protein